MKVSIPYPVERPYFDIQPLQNGALPYHTQRAEHYELLWLREGSGTLYFHTGNVVIDNCTIYCLAPGQMRSAYLQHAEGYYVSFSPDFIAYHTLHQTARQWLDNLYPGGLFLKTTAIMRLETEDVLRAMCKEAFSKCFLRHELLAGLLNILFIYFSRCMGEESISVHSGDRGLTQRFMFLLRKNYISKKMVSDYAGELFVTPNYLNRTVKKITGRTASHHIQQQIITEAKRQAIQTNASMKEIAYQLGFEDPAHFSRFFKNKSGMNFSSFAKGTTSLTGS